jgi:hypothetical protein
MKKRERASANESLCEIANLAFCSRMVLVYPLVWIASNTPLALSEIGQVPKQQLASLKYRWNVLGRKVFVERWHVFG